MPAGFGAAALETVPKCGLGFPRGFLGCHCAARQAQGGVREGFLHLMEGALRVPLIRT